MPRLRTANKTNTRMVPDRVPTATDNALYTYDLLISLKRLADVHNQSQLAELIASAAAEAQALSKHQPEKTD